MLENVFAVPHSKRTIGWSNSATAWRTSGSSRCSGLVNSVSLAFENHLSRSSRRFSTNDLKSGCVVGSCKPCTTMLSILSPPLDSSMMRRAADVTITPALGGRWPEWIVQIGDGRSAAFLPEGVSPASDGSSTGTGSMTRLAPSRSFFGEPYLIGP